jgi:hypothetical protein
MTPLHAPAGSTSPGVSTRWGADAATLFGATSSAFYSLAVDSAGLSRIRQDLVAFSGKPNLHIHYDSQANRVYADDGSALDPVTGAIVGSLGACGLVVIDGGLHKAWRTPQLVFFESGTIAVESYDLQTLSRVASISLHVDGAPMRLIRWGTDGLAFNTSAGQVYVLRGSFVN